MYKKKKIALVIPCYKVSNLINQVIKSIPSFVDKIYVIDGGKIVGEGNHKELLENSTVYKNFYEKQIRKN